MLEKQKDVVLINSRHGTARRTADLAWIDWTRTTRVRTTRMRTTRLRTTRMRATRKRTTRNRTTSKRILRRGLPK